MCLLGHHREDLKIGRFHRGVRSHKLFMVLKNLPAKTCSLKVHSFVPRKARLSSFGSALWLRPGLASDPLLAVCGVEPSRKTKQFVAKN